MKSGCQLICSDHIESVTALGPSGQAFDVFEGAGRMRAHAVFRVKNAGLGERQSSRAVDQTPLGDQFSTCRLHETGFHFYRDHTHVWRHTARSMCHGHIQQRHAGAAVGDVERIQMLWLGLEIKLRMPALEQLEFEPQVAHEGDLNTKLNRLLLSQFSPLSRRTHHHQRPSIGR